MVTQKCFRYLWILSFIPHILSQMIYQSVTLTPYSHKLNGANLQTHYTEVKAFNNTWNVQIKSQSSWQFILILDSTWGFDPHLLSSIKITINSPSISNGPSTFDWILFGFTTDNTEYISSLIAMENVEHNRIYPGCNNSSTSSMMHGIGDVASLPHFDRSCDIADHYCSNWKDLLPINIPHNPNKFPITFQLDNDPHNDVLRFVFNNNAFKQQCTFVASPTNRGLKVYIGGNDLGQSFKISSIDITASIDFTKSNIKEPSSTKTPTVFPTKSPSNLPSKIPTSTPTNDPTQPPSIIPSQSPTQIPTYAPSSSIPTVEPTAKPITSIPSQFPTQTPSYLPSVYPTMKPTLNPTQLPSQNPSYSPSVYPTMKPTLIPTQLPSYLPSLSPSNVPTIFPTNIPSINPSMNPSIKPTTTPTSDPSIPPTSIPTTDPTIIPTQSTIVHVTQQTKYSTTLPTAYPLITPNELTWSPSAVVTKQTNVIVDWKVRQVDQKNSFIVPLTVCALSLTLVVFIRVCCHYGRQYKFERKQYAQQIDNAKKFSVAKFEPVTSCSVIRCHIIRVHHGERMMEYKLNQEHDIAGPINDHQWNDKTYFKLINTISYEFNLFLTKFRLYENVIGVDEEINNIEDIIMAFDSATKNPNGKRSIDLWVQITDHVGELSGTESLFAITRKSSSRSTFHSRQSSMLMDNWDQHAISMQQMITPHGHKPDNKMGVIEHKSSISMQMAMEYICNALNEEGDRDKIPHKHSRTDIVSHSAPTSGSEDVYID